MEVDSFTISNNVVTGILTGVSAGLILAAFAYARQHIDYIMDKELIYG